MLSIDITDKQLKLVRGSLAGSKIRVNAVETRDVPEGSIVNGYVTNVPLVAGELTDMFEAKKISEKEITVCINSSSILYKELEIPKPKKISNSTAIEAMIIAHMGISSDYNISYSIVGESVDIDKRATIKLLATACPQRMVDSYQGLFNQLGMKLKQINVSNNCITRLILNSPNLKQSMPFLCAQVDVDFVNINLYENGQVALSRYAKIDPADYENNPDYINIAVFDNLFRMIQYIGQRPNSRPLKQIMFYGVIKDFVALSNSIQSFNIPSHVLAMPNNIVKYCELDFSRYANAIGAFYKTDPVLDHVNLLQSKAVVGRKSANTFPLKVFLLSAATAGLVFGAKVVVDQKNDSITKKIAAVQAEIDNPEYAQRQERMNAKQIIFDNFQSYRYSVMIAKDFFDFQPRGYLPQINENIRGAIDKTPDSESFIIFDTVTVTGYNVDLTMYCNSVDFPSDFVESLVNQGFFEDIEYTGFEAVTWKEFAGESFLMGRLYYLLDEREPWKVIEPVNQAEMDEINKNRNNSKSTFYRWKEQTAEEDGKILKFTLTMKIKAGHIFIDGGKTYEYKPDHPISQEIR